MGRRAGGIVAIAIGSVAWCAVLSGLVGGDPMLAVEIGGVALTTLWAGLVLRDLAASRRLARALAADADAIDLFGVPCHVTPALGADAVVVGSVRPRIFLGASLLSSLTDEELEAVVYHEDHHRRTRAPIKAAALGAWLRLLSRSGSIRTIVLDRLIDIETLADADAIRRGSSPRSLARALLKGDLGLRPAAFSYAADRRVERLLDRAAGIPVEATSRLPYEWLPVALLALVTLGCHLGL